MIRPKRATLLAATGLSLVIVATGRLQAQAPAPQTEPCTPETESVTPMASVNAEDVFISWAPACGVAVLIVEEGSDDRWGLMVPMETWSVPDQANLILPGLFYGDAPQGRIDVRVPPVPLRPGVTYNVGLWRILPEASLPSCTQRRENACLIATFQFTR